VSTLVEIFSGESKNSPNDFFPLKISLTTTRDHLSPNMNKVLTKEQVEQFFLIIDGF
jgi:hypothetical protein